MSDRTVLARWLCRDEADRQRWFDMGDRVQFARLLQGGVLSVAGVVVALWYGWWVIALVASAGVILGALEVRSDYNTPETDAAAIVGLDVILAMAVAITGGARSPMLCFVMVPVLMLAVRFRRGVVTWGVLLCLGLTGAAMVVAFWLPQTRTAPTVLYAVCFVALLLSLQAASLALLSAEVQSRVDAVVDPLTGLFNRTSLPGRFGDIAVQARLLDGPVGVAMLDLDHFKKVNDGYGHDRGDLVLRDVAYCLRKSLRTFDLVYRLGGEEFAILLPGLDLDGARQVTERVIADVAGTEMAGLSLTMSAGVTCGVGDELELKPLLKAADRALYAAKHAGRNRVHTVLPGN